MYEIDELDREIIALLKRDAKLSIKEIANLVGITTTPVHNRIKNWKNRVLLKSMSR